MHNAGTVYNGTNTGMVWNRVALGGGGYTMRPRFSSDNTLVIATDTDQGFVRGPSATVFTPLLTAAITGYSFNYAYAGTLDTTIHRTNSSCIATWFGGYIWMTTNGGGNIAKVAGLAENRTLDPNGTNHTLPGYRIEYDSATTGLAFADASTGLRYTTNGGTTFTTSSSVLVPLSDTSGAGMFVAFDRSSTVTSGKFQTVYCYSAGRGVYRSTTGVDGTFTLIGATPTNIYDMKVGPTGILHVVLTDGTAKKWTLAGGWVTVTGFSGSGAYSVTPHISDATKVFWVGPGGTLFGSTDSGATADRYDTSPIRVSNDIPWLAWTLENYMSNGGGGEYHPSTDRIVIGEGIGVWSTDTPLPSAGSNGATTWTSLTKGIENLDTMEHTITPGGRLAAAFLDRAFFTWSTSTLSTYPGKHGPARTVSLNHGTSIDYAGDNSAFIVGVCSETGKEGGYSSDGGVTWTQFATPSDVGYGNIAVSTTQKWVWLPTSNRRPYYTANGGSTWTACSLPGASFPGDSTARLHNGFSYQRRCLVADKDNPGHLYLFAYGNEAKASGDATDPLQGVWKSTDGGANFTRIYLGRFNTSNIDFFNCKLRIKSNGLGNAPDLFWVPGDINSYDSTHSPGVMWFSRGGVTWNSITWIDEPYDIAFGKTLWSGQAYPTLYVYGYVSNQIGLYRSHDFDPVARTATLTRVGPAYPVNATDRYITLSADMNSYKVVIGWGGSGLAYGDYDDTAHAT